MRTYASVAEVRELVLQTVRSGLFFKAVESPPDGLCEKCIAVLSGTMSEPVESLSSGGVTQHDLPEGSRP